MKQQIITYTKNKHQRNVDGVTKIHCPKVKSWLRHKILTTMGASPMHLEHVRQVERFICEHIFFPATWAPG